MTSGNLKLSAIDAYGRLEEMKLVLPEPRKPVAKFAAHIRTGSLIYLSGQGPVDADGPRTGKVGSTVTPEEAYQHARLAGINLVSVMEQATGDLRRITRIVKVLGMVNAIPEFEDHPRVIDGCSDLLIDIFGLSGVHARSAVGVASLPRQITVEVEAVIECG